MKLKLIILAFILVLVLLFFIRFVLGGPEDSWICDQGQWVKHGNPAASQPQGICTP